MSPAAVAPSQNAEQPVAPVGHESRAAALPVGVVGAGTIGQISLEKLVAADFVPLMCDPAEAAREAAGRLGARVAEDAAQVVAECDVVILCLPNSRVVEAVVDAVLPHVREGQLFINTSTCLPESDVACERRVRGQGGAWVDAPLTRRGEGFVFMCGGSQGDYERAAPLLEVIGARHKLLGPVGAGQTGKLMQQMLSAMEKCARLEVAAFGRRAGIDPRFLKDYLGFGLSERLLAEGTGDHATLQMMYKDLGYFLQVAHENGAHAPIASLTHEIFKTSTRVSDGTWDHDAVHAFYRLTNVQSLEERTSPVLGSTPKRLWEE